MATNDDIADALTSHSIGLQRLSNRTVREIVELLSKADARIVERLLREDVTALSRARQEKLLKDIRRIIESVYEDATGQLQIQLDALAEYERDYQLDMLRRVVPIDLDWITPTGDQIVAAVTSRPFEGKLLADWYSKLASDAATRVADNIRMGVVEQRTIAQMVRDIRGTRAQGYKDGVLAVNKRAAEAVVRTAVNHTATTSRERLYDRNRKYIKGQQWLSTLDTRTSAPCRAADNRVAIGEGYTRRNFPKGTKFLKDVPGFTNETRPPYHFNCRSTTTPVLRSARELGLKGPELTDTTRSSMNGQVAADMSYDQWLRKQSAEVQDEVLGKTKGKLYRQGGLSVDRFVNDKGEELTLDQLRQREAAAWDKAGLTQRRRQRRRTPILSDERDAPMRDEVLRLGKRQEIEHLRAYDAKTGKEFRNKGQRNFVGVSDELLAAITDPKSDVTVHHNHPSSRSFSPQDMRMIGANPGLKRLFAHGHDGTIYRADRKDTFGENTLALANNAAAAPFIEKEAEFAEPEDRNVLFHHVVSSWLGARGLVDYRAEMRGATRAAYDRNKGLIDAIIAGFSK